MTNYQASQKAKEVTTIEVLPSELKLIQLIRKIEWGELNQIKIQEGLPVMVKAAYKTLKLIN